MGFSQTELKQHKVKSQLQFNINPNPKRLIESQKQEQNASNDDLPDVSKINIENPIKTYFILILKIFFVTK